MTALVHRLIGRMELHPVYLILRSRAQRGVSKDGHWRSLALAVLRDADLRSAPQDEVDG
jgi:hypothetical protein